MADRPTRDSSGPSAHSGTPPVKRRTVLGAVATAAATPAVLGMAAPSARKKPRRRRPRPERSLSLHARGRPHSRTGGAAPSLTEPAS
jgi:hypothetical protein